MPSVQFSNSPFSIIASKYMKTKWIFCEFSISVLPRQCRASSGTQIIAEKPHPSKYCDLLSHSSDQISLTFAFNLYARFRLAHIVFCIDLIQNMNKNEYFNFQSVLGLESTCSNGNPTTTIIISMRLSSSSFLS